MQRAPRLLLWFPGAAALVLGMWAGLARMGVVGPTALAPSHGALMVMGFLGTLISLERAVALGARWAYLVPAVFGLGALGTLLGLPHAEGLFVVGALGLLGLFVRLLQLDRGLHMVVMSGGALALLGGACLYAARQPAHITTWWWAGFPVLTIVGERLELNRVRRLPALATNALLAMVGGLFVALVTMTPSADLGTWAVGLCLAVSAVWLLWFDVATRTVRSQGLTRFIAVCLLSGYAWLATAGLLAMSYGVQPAGPWYDAQIHAVFVGFVFSMIFGHAPVIMPAVLGLPLRYTRWAYLPLVLLHVGLVARVAGDLTMSADLRQAGGTLNVSAVLLFALVSVASMWAAQVTGAPLLPGEPREA